MDSDVVVRFDRCKFGTGKELTTTKIMKTDLRSDSEEVLGGLTVTYTKRQERIPRYMQGYLERRAYT
jgi:hypothetical protein